MYVCNLFNVSNLLTTFLHLVFESEKLAIYLKYKKKYPRAETPRALPLTFTTGMYCFLFFCFFFVPKNKQYGVD